MKNKKGLNWNNFQVDLNDIDIVYGNNVNILNKRITNEITNCANKTANKI